MKVILETDRLLLREYVEEDAEAFFKLNTDPEVLPFVPDKASPGVEQARQILIDHPMANYRKYGFGRGAGDMPVRSKTGRGELGPSKAPAPARFAFLLFRAKSRNL
jgi:RimJ/RimL family protein N-acetyltransferase